MANPEIDVAYVAKLARLKLSDAERDLFQAQLAHILEYAEKLREVDLSAVEQTAPSAAMSDVFRDDEARPWFTAEEALRNAPHHAKNLFVVPKVLG